ncbi:MAG: imelysin family protein, partial [Bacteroidota bacterium]
MKATSKFVISAWIASLFLVFGLSSCQPKEASPEEVQAVLVQYAQMVYLNYQDALTEAQQLYDMVALFATEPNQNRLEGAKAAWIKARLPYGLTEAYRFYGGPIDHDALGREG